MNYTNIKGEKREKLRVKGQFWTPNWIARPMSKYVSVPNTDVCDVAVGEGVFLKNLEILNKKINLYGYEKDKDLKKILINTLSKNTLRNIKYKDFITCNTAFDSIIGNPPYIRHHRLNLYEKKKFRKMVFEICGFNIDQRAGLHIYMFIKALSLLKKNGKLCFIISSDIVEGKFSKLLWNWVFKNFNLEAIINFDDNAAPFKGVDTNAIVLCIKNSVQNNHVKWIKIKEINEKEIFKLFCNEFKISTNSIFTKEVNYKELASANFTNLPAKIDGYKLSNFCNIKRGLVTGDNNFFLFNTVKINRNSIPKRYFKRTISRTRYCTNSTLDIEYLNDLDKKGVPTYLLYIEEKNFDLLDENLQKYLKQGELNGVNKKTLISTKKFWYVTEKRNPPDYIFTYLGRRKIRFILNKSKAIPLTTFLCVYKKFHNSQVKNFFNILNDDETIFNLNYVSKKYGNGALKTEPRQLDNLIISKKLINKNNFNIEKK